MDQLEARRGIGLAIKFPLGEPEGEKVKGEREEIWSEKEEELAGPPRFSSPLPLPPRPSVCPALFFSFFLLLLPFFAVFLGESGRSKVNRKSDAFICEL